MKAFRDREFPKRSRGCTGINRFPFTQELAGERKKVQIQQSYVPEGSLVLGCYFSSFCVPA